MQILRAVVVSGSVSAAARNLGYTPSAVSQQVSVLEKEAGIALLERVGRGVRPTAAGRLLTGHAAVISQNLAEAEAQLADLRAGRTGRLAIHYFSSVGPTLMAPALARFRQEHPGVQVDLRLVDSSDPLPKAERERADLAIVVRAGDEGRGDEGGDGIRLVHLLDDAYRVVLPAAHRLAGERTLDLADLAGEAWVSADPPGPCLQPMLDACAAAGFTPNFVARTEDYATARGFVAAGLGIGMMPRLGLGDTHPGVVVRRIRPEPVRTIHAAVPEIALAQPALRTLLDALKDAAKQ